MQGLGHIHLSASCLHQVPGNTASLWAGVRGSSLPWLLYCMRSASWQGPSADDARRFAVRLKWMPPAEGVSDMRCAEQLLFPLSYFVWKVNSHRKESWVPSWAHWEVREHHLPCASLHGCGIFLQVLVGVQPPEHYIAWVIFPEFSPSLCLFLSPICFRSISEQKESDFVCSTAVPHLPPSITLKALCSCCTRALCELAFCYFRIL